MNARPTESDASPSAPTVMVATADRALLDQVLSAAAALSLEPWVLPEASAARQHWATVPLVVVGADWAPTVAALTLPHRVGVVVVGAEADREAACAWSTPLGASVVTLPSGADALVRALAEAGGTPAGAGRLVAVVGGSGGVGTSTFAAALAFRAGREGWSALLVDTDAFGGGLDVLVGAEDMPGWRWPHLAGARGRLGALDGRLPNLDGVDVLSAGRAGTGGRPRLRIGEPRADQLVSVLESARRSHDLTVVDLTRTVSELGTEAVRRADLTLVVVRADLRGVAAARERVAAWRDDLPAADLAVVVRRRRVGALAAAQVGAAVGLPVVGTVGDDRSVETAAERGDPPGRARGSTLAKVCRDVLVTVSEQGRAA